MKISANIQKLLWKYIIYDKKTNKMNVLDVNGNILFKE